MRNHVRSRLNAVLLATAAATAFYGVVPAYAADEITQPENRQERPGSKEVRAWQPQGSDCPQTRRREGIP